MSEDKSKRLREKFIRFAKRLEKQNPILTEKILTHVAELVEWYLRNDRDITAKEFSEIVDKE